jgi:drug/metabolite transporter (DMT)-like permease
VEAEEKSAGATRTQILAAFGAVYIIWGSTYLAIRFALETMPPFLLAGVRYVVAGLIVYGFQRARGGVRPKPVHWRSALIVGALLILVGNGAVVWAELRIPSGIAALVVAISPCWMVLLDWLWDGNARPSVLTAAGLLLGFAGLALLIAPGVTGAAGGLDVPGLGAVVFGSLCWAVGSVYSKRAPLPRPQLLATGMEMLCGGVLLVVLGAAVGEVGSVELSAISLRSALALLYLIVFGSLIAFAAYVWLLQEVPAARVSTYAYVNPLVAVLLGWALAGEELTATKGAAAAVIIAGVIMITVGDPLRRAAGARAVRRLEPSRGASPDRQ